MAELTKTEIKEIKIEQGKIDEISDDLTNQFEIIENSIIAQKNVALTKYSLNTDFKTWKEKQKIVRSQLKKDIEKSIQETQKVVDKSIQETFDSVSKVVVGIGNEKAEAVKKKVDRVNIEGIANKGIKLFANKVMNEYDKSVAKIYKLRNQEPLFDAILKQTQEGIDKAPYKIAYKKVTIVRNGREIKYSREVSFKSYMEMNIRTTTRQEANKFLFQASKSNGVVFYICSSFGDCADDHKHVQGKYYYDQDWPSFGYDKETSKKIKETISRYNMQSYQSVVNKAPYLTTRPNCRHTLRPVVLTDVFENNEKEMLEKYKIEKGTFKDGNYQALQRQRAIERNLRFYKSRLETHELMKKENPDPKLLKQIDKDIKLIAEWEKEMKKLLKANGFLKRDKRRESNKILVQDAGAGYSLGLKIDGKNMYVKGANKK